MTKVITRFIEAQRAVCRCVIVLSVAILLAACSGHVADTGSRESRYYINLYNGYFLNESFDKLLMTADSIMEAEPKQKSVYAISALYAAQASLSKGEYNDTYYYLSCIDTTIFFPDFKGLYENIFGVLELNHNANYPEAQKHLLNAYEYFKKVQNYSNEGIALCNLSIIYYIRRDTSGIRYAREACELGAKHGNLPYLSFTGHIAMAYSLLLKEDYKGAEKHILSAKVIASECSSILYNARINHVLGEVAYHDGQLSHAADLLESGMKLAFVNEKNIYPEIAVSYARILMEMEKDDKAEELLADLLVQMAGNELYQYRIYLLLSEIYENRGDRSASYDCYKKYVSIKENVLNMEREQEFNRTLLQYERAAFNQTIKKKQAIIYISVSAAILCVIALSLAFFFYRKLDRAYLQLVENQQRKFSIMHEHVPETDRKPDEDMLFRRLESLMKEKRIWCDNEYSLDKIASILETSKTNISKAIKDCSGHNFYGYLNMYRIEEAIRILSDDQSDIRLKCLYETLGYNSNEVFYRIFKKEVGCTPLQYREYARKLRMEKSMGTMI